MSQSAFSTIVDIVDKTIVDARNIICAMPRQEVETEVEWETNCSPSQELSSSTSASAHSEQEKQMTTEVYVTRNRKTIVVATYVEFENPVSDERCQKFAESRHSAEALHVSSSDDSI